MMRAATGFARAIALAAAASTALAASRPFASIAAASVTTPSTTAVSNTVESTPAISTPAVSDASVSAAASAPPSVETTDLGGLVATARATPQVVEVGQTIAVEIVFEGEGARTVALELPESARNGDAPTLGEFDLVAVRGATTDAAGRATIALSLASYDAGDAALPALTVSWTKAGARVTGEVRLPSVRIESLVGAEADPTKFRDIQGEVDEPRALRWRMLAWIAAAAVVAAIVAAWWLLSRRRPAAPVAPDAWARAELARIERESLAARGEFGRYYDDLTSVVRGYVSRRFEIPADRQTSREFESAARAHLEFPADQAARLRELLRLADLVKFAAAVPSRAECDANLAEARAFVERTRPVEPAQDRPAAGANTNNSTNENTSTNRNTSTSADARPPEERRP